MTHYGHAFPRLYIQCDSVEDFSVVIVAKNHIIHNQMSLDVFEYFGVIKLTDARFHTHNLNEPFQSRKTVGEHLREGCKFPYRCDK